MYVNLKINKNIKITQLSDLENLRKQIFTEKCFKERIFYQRYLRN